MKYLHLVLSFFIATGSFAQLSITVVPKDTIVCYKDSIIFISEVNDAFNISYQWQKNDTDIPFANDSVYHIDSVRPSDTGFYRCIVWKITDPVNRDTSNEAHLRMHPKLNIDTLYRFNELGCPGICKGQFYVHISGGKPPYNYYWGGGHSQDTIVFKLCEGLHTFKVTDSLNCSLSKKYYVDVLRLPKIDVTLKPGDTIYLTNPTATVSFPDDSKKYLTNWEWNFGDSTRIPNINPVSHIYQKTGKYILSLNFTDQNGCDTTINRDVTVKIAQLKIPNAFTPNKDDEINKDFRIKVLDAPDIDDYRVLYLSTELFIFDRWGRKVYHAINYESGAWDGGHLPDGVYFYVLKCQGEFGQDVYKGSVTILGRDFSGPQ